MDRETPESRDERSIKDADTARENPDAVPGVVVDRRPEKMWVTRPVFFWLTVSGFVLLVALNGWAAWKIGTVFDRIAMPASLGTMAQGMGSSIRMMYIGLTFAPLLALGGLVYQRSAARRGQSRRKTACVLNIAGLVSFGVLLSLIPWQLGGMSGVEYVPAYLIAGVGAFVLVFAIDPNAPVSLHCRKCNYEFVPGPRSPRVCPECGRDWLGRRGLVRRRHEKKFTKPRVMGISLLLVAWLAMVAAPTIHQFVPTGWLITLASKPLSNLDSSDWHRLQPTQLSDSQVQRLAVGLLDKRRADGEFDFGSSDTWFEAAIVDGRITPELVDQYHHAWFAITITTPDRIVSTRSFEAGLETTLQTMWASGLREISVVFGGFRLEEGEMQSRGGKIVHPYAIMEEASPDHPYRPTASFVAGAPGQSQITAEYWLIAWPTGLNKPASLDWNEDGSLQRPPEALYFKRFEIVKTIEVQPR
jgi:hypothetical protein